ncbi:unknown [[Mannheimia] succiniciproducens MBEL55E]|uniref:Uncharacterized protein n=1 Tax=Mannheimia succiniciproducens (strain KCTC 0769BP / MBEL55E) TaxID=221988 RepID=Q65QN2_MANSM|nr:unknown [[Mannheimia] succiniciproducens MBEL55E]
MVAKRRIIGFYLYLHKIYKKPTALCKINAVRRFFRYANVKISLHFLLKVA